MRQTPEWCSGMRMFILKQLVECWYGVDESRIWNGIQLTNWLRFNMICGIEEHELRERKANRRLKKITAAGETAVVVSILLWPVLVPLAIRLPYCVNAIIRKWLLTNSIVAIDSIRVESSSTILIACFRVAYHLYALPIRCHPCRWWVKCSLCIRRKRKKKSSQPHNSLFKWDIEEWNTCNKNLIHPIYCNAGTHFICAAFGMFSLSFYAHILGWRL